MASTTRDNNSKRSMEARELEATANIAANAISRTLLDVEAELKSPLLSAFLSDFNHVDQSDVIIPRARANYLGQVETNRGIPIRIKDGMDISNSLSATIAEAKSAIQDNIFNDIQGAIYSAKNDIQEAGGYSNGYRKDTEAKKRLDEAIKTAKDTYFNLKALTLSLYVLDNACNELAKVDILEDTAPALSYYSDKTLLEELRLMHESARDMPQCVPQPSTIQAVREAHRFNADAFGGTQERDHSTTRRVNRHPDRGEGGVPPTGGETRFVAPKRQMTGRVTASWKWHLDDYYPRYLSWAGLDQPTSDEKILMERARLDALYNDISDNWSMSSAIKLWAEINKSLLNTNYVVFSEGDHSEHERITMRLTARIDNVSTEDEASAISRELLIRYANFYRNEIIDYVKVIEKYDVQQRNNPKIHRHAEQIRGHLYQAERQSIRKRGNTGKAIA